MSAHLAAYPDRSAGTWAAVGDVADRSADGVRDCSHGPGAWPWLALHVLDGDLGAAGRAGARLDDGTPAAAVAKQARWAVRSTILVTPVHQRDHHGPQVAGLLGLRVLVA